MTPIFLTAVFFCLFITIVYLLIQSAPPLPPNINATITHLQNSPLIEMIPETVKQTHNRAVKLNYEITESESEQNETILLINGHSQVLTDWPSYFYTPLVEAGFNIIRFDNRGVGQSDWMVNYDKKNPYSLEDMATDIIAILDAERIPKAHIIGMSMGGMIGQRLAISHAERVLSLTSIMSTGHFYDKALTNIPFDFYKKLVAVSIKYPLYSKKESTQLKLNLAIRQLQVGQGDYPLDHELILRRGLYELRQRDGYNLKVTDQHSLAIKVSGSRYQELGRISVPTLVIHGTTDPLIKLEHAEKYAPMIPNATTLFIEGMGHDLPPVFVPRMIAAIKKNIERTNRQLVI
ncbi:MAG: alpha/beta hydrolase [Bacteroidota bacterium]